jgi:hypothetical protein
VGEEGEFWEMGANRTGVPGVRKQVAKTSSSLAFSQILRPWLRQKARLQSAQVGLWWCGCFSSEEGEESSLGESRG